jgi:hypothetical protein
MNMEQEDAYLDPFKRTRVPGVVRAYGTFIMVVCAIGMGLGVLNTLLAFGRPVMLLMLLFTICQVVFFRLGKGLCRGDRHAVYALCILSGLALVVGIGLLTEHEVVDGVALVLAAIFCAPPITSAYRHWTAFA